MSRDYLQRFFNDGRSYSRSADGAPCALDCGILFPNTLTADLNTTAAIASPIRISGQGELVAATSPAAANTPTLEITSLREHSHVLAMFTSCRRNRHSPSRE
jgi:hypothetical protein